MRNFVENFNAMKKNQQNSKPRYSASRHETLPLLRGMFICPEPLKRLKKYAGSDLLSDVFTKTNCDYAGA